MDANLKQRAAAIRPARSTAFLDRLNRVSGAGDPASSAPADAGVVAGQPSPEQGKPVRAPRKASSATAYITFERLSTPIATRVVNMSATGARLQLTPGPSDVLIPPRDFPDRITMIFRTDRAMVDCTIQWRTEREIGVRFASATRISATPVAIRHEPVKVGASRFAPRPKKP